MESRDGEVDGSTKHPLPKCLSCDNSCLGLLRKLKGFVMKEGAFALIDCLGWKGIWQQTTEFALIDKIAKIHDKVGSVIEEINSRHRNMSSGPIRAQIRLISV